MLGESLVLLFGGTPILFTCKWQSPSPAASMCSSCIIAGEFRFHPSLSFFFFLFEEEHYIYPSQHLTDSEAIPRPKSSSRVISRRLSPKFFRLLSGGWAEKKKNKNKNKKKKGELVEYVSKKKKGGENFIDTYMLVIYIRHFFVT